MSGCRSLPDIGQPYKNVKRMNGVQKKPITATLRDLDVGGVAFFPYEQNSSLVATISKLRKELRRSNWNVVTEDNDATMETKVRRTS